jgi:hypothetical protein
MLFKALWFCEAFDFISVGELTPPRFGGEMSFGRKKVEHRM